MKKEIKFSLVYRDMWQSSGKYQPRADQLAKIAPLIVEMGCFARVETNGGAFEQVNLLYGENPNKAVRTFTKPLREAGIQTHMLDRGLNALRMYPVPADVRRLMYKVKHAQGVDITRIFCGLNEVRNIIPSIKYAKEAGMIPQATLCITYSPVHTVDYYSYIADQLIEAGAPEICLKGVAVVGIALCEEKGLVQQFLHPVGARVAQVQARRGHEHHLLRHLVALVPAVGVARLIQNADQIHISSLHFFDQFLRGAGGDTQAHPGVFPSELPHQPGQTEKQRDSRVPICRHPFRSVSSLMA